MNTQLSNYMLYFIVEQIQDCVLHVLSIKKELIQFSTKLLEDCWHSNSCKYIWEAAAHVQARRN